MAVHRSLFRRLLRTSGALVLLLAAVGACVLLVVPDRDPDRGAPPPVDTATAAPAFDEAIAAARALVERVREYKLYPSLSAAVARDGTVVWREAVGYANLADRVRATVDTRYAIGSISKPLTAIVALRLVESGGLVLNAPIETYLPDLPAHYHGVTIRQLLSHQAGVRHYAFAFFPPLFNESSRNTEYPTVESGLGIFLDDPLLFAPDSNFSYSTYGYSLASRVLEAVAQEDFLALTKRVLVDPLGLAATVPDRASPVPAFRSADYISLPMGLGLVPAPATNSSYKWAGGGFVSTPTDLVQLGAALLSGEILPSSRFAEMTTARHLASGEENPQAYGLRSGGLLQLAADAARGFFARASAP